MAFFNDQEHRHAEVSAAVEVLTEPLVVSPFVIAELDYLIASRHGVDNEIAVLRALQGGAFLVVDVDVPALAKAVDVVARYRDQDIGVTDASLVVLAERFRTKTILTLDRRHFDVLKPLDGGDFILLP